MTPGIYPDLPMADYLALPALSAGVVRTMVDRCPLAAWHESPLNEARVIDTSPATDTGSIAHAILLEGSRECVAVIDPQDHPAEKTGAIPDGWTNKSIRAARDAARAAGKIPVLAPAMAAIDAMAAQALAFIASLRDSEPAIWAAFRPDGGRSEVTMVWQEGDTLCKLRADRIASDHGVIIDYKTSAMSVEPDRWGRTQLVSMGYYVSAAWYRRGVRALTGVDPSYVFLCQEVDPPYLCSLVGLDPAGLELGDEKCGAGLRQWQECARTGDWPAYPNRVCYPELPVYERARWDERNGIGADGIPYDVSKLWGPPRDPFKREAA